MLAMVLFAGVRGRIEHSDIPKSLQGLPITLVSASLVSISFLGFSGAGGRIICVRGREDDHWCSHCSNNRSCGRSDLVGGPPLSLLCLWMKNRKLFGRLFREPTAAPVDFPVVTGMPKPSPKDLPRLACVPPEGKTWLMNVPPSLEKTAGNVEKKVALVRCAGHSGNVSKKTDYDGVNTCQAVSMMYGGDSACAFGCLATATV